LKVNQAINVINQSKIFKVVQVLKITSKSTEGKEEWIRSCPRWCPNMRWRT